MARSPRLTAVLQQRIAASIRAGADPHAAAEAWEVPVARFEDWLARGSGAKAREPYRSFAMEVRTARAQARTRAEMEVFQKTPKVWLEEGPGSQGPFDEENALLNRTLMAIFDVLYRALAPFPDARAAAARALAGRGMETSLSGDVHESSQENVG